MSEKQNIDTPHEGGPFRDHGHMEVIALGGFTVGRVSSSQHGDGPPTCSRSPGRARARSTTRGSACPDG